MVIAGLIFYEKAHRPLLGQPLLVALGDSSYSLYLIHIFVINALGKIWFSVTDRYQDLFILACVVLSVLVGHVAYILFEKPITTYLSTKYRHYKMAK